MEHREYIRITGSDRPALLMIHGIVGTPAHFHGLMPAVAEDRSVYNILLDGHGKGVQEFAGTSMAKWKAQVKTVLADILTRHEKVVIIAHSMGSLFAIQAAIDHPDRVASLFLLAVPTRPWVRFSTMLTALRVAWGNVSPADTAATAMHNDCSVQLERKLWKYIAWLPRFWELLTEIRRVRGQLPDLKTPTLTFQSHRDELVSSRSCKDLNGHPYIQNTVLYRSGHFAYSPEDTALLQKRLAELLHVH